MDILNRGYTELEVLWRARPYFCDLKSDFY